MSHTASDIFNSHVNALFHPTTSPGNRMVQAANIGIFLAAVYVGSLILAFFAPIAGLLTLVGLPILLILGQMTIALVVTRKARLMDQDGTLHHFHSLWLDMMIVGLQQHLPQFTTITSFHLRPTAPLQGPGEENGFFQSSNPNSPYDTDITDIDSNAAYRNLVWTTRKAAMMEAMPSRWARYVYGKTVHFHLNTLTAPPLHTISAQRRLVLEKALAQQEA